MNGVVDLTNLREITGGDLTIERELFQSFVESAADCLAALKATTVAGQENEWRRQAHAFKGSSLNLGAGKLGDLCKEAQDNFQASPEIKQALCIAIEGELGRVKNYLKQASA